MLVGLTGNDRSLKAGQKPLHLGQAQAQVRDLPKTFRPANLHQVSAPRAGIIACLNQPQHPPHPNSSSRHRPDWSYRSYRRPPNLWTLPFAEWQTYVKALGERGVVLAVCSKNSPEIAATGFANPHSVLRRADFAAFECSWNDKVGGLRRIARDLNLGIDSFVFADDNPAECALVRQELAEVAVVHLGDDPGEFIEKLDAGHWFDLPHYTSEDLGRASAYNARAAALAEQSQATDLGGFLGGLEMKGRLYRPEEADIPRVAQLEQKTNQFNLTTRRYAEAAIRDFLTRNDAIVLAFRLADRLGDHGLVSTLIALQENETLRIDSWLMSCRVFSRSAEQFILRGLIDLARQRGVTRLAGKYLPTPKNDVVADLYERMGFSLAAGDAL
jgi:FkbH-like protein